jgi:hypothetical protein
MTIQPDDVNPHVEPCLSCGEETAIGSIFYSDRFEGTSPDGRRFFVCSECRKRVHAQAGGVDMSDPDVYLSMVAAAQFTFRDSSF